MLRVAGRLANLYPGNDPIGAVLIDKLLDLTEVFTERCLRWERENEAMRQYQLEHELTTTIMPHSFIQIDAKLAALNAYLPFVDSPSTLYIHDLAVRSFMEFIIRPDWEGFLDRDAVHL